MPKKLLENIAGMKMKKNMQKCQIFKKSVAETVTNLGYIKKLIIFCKCTQSDIAMSQGYTEIKLDLLIINEYLISIAVNNNIRNASV
jgi:hypothetical protein